MQKSSARFMVSFPVAKAFLCWMQNPVRLLLRESPGHGEDARAL